MLNGITLGVNRFISVSVLDRIRFYCISVCTLFTRFNYDMALCSGCLCNSVFC